MGVALPRPFGWFNMVYKFLIVSFDHCLRDAKRTMQN
jgi:hypothetical protein